MTMRMPSTVSGEMQQCISECLSCHVLCEASIQYCLGQGGKHVEASRIGTKLDFAQA